MVLDFEFVEQKNTYESGFIVLKYSRKAIEFNWCVCNQLMFGLHYTNLWMVVCHS